MIGNRYEYDAMAVCEQHMWWYRCLHDLTLSSIKKNYKGDPRILDAGCGTGGLLLQLKENGYLQTDGFDLSIDAIEYARTKSEVQVQQLDITGFSGVYPSNTFDVVISHDIVCLLNKGEDRTAIAQMIEVLKPGGWLLMNFPALNAFNGTHDKAVGIQKRYSKKEIRELVSGLAEISEMLYWPFLLSPAIVATRMLQKIKSVFITPAKIISDVKMPPRLLNQALYKLTRFENGHIKTKPWGSSLFVVMQKPV